MKAVLYTVCGMMLIVGSIAWFFVGLNHSGRIDTCNDVVWSSSKGFDECVDMEVHIPTFD